MKAEESGDGDGGWKLEADTAVRRQGPPSGTIRPDETTPAPHPAERRGGGVVGRSAHEVMVMSLVNDRSDDFGATLFARIPIPLDEDTRRVRYDLPLKGRLDAAGIGHVLRGFNLPATLSHPAGVALEVRFDSVASCFSVIPHLIGIGAPPETLVEIDTDTASMQMTLEEEIGK
jgi:hypothetical protein